MQGLYMTRARRGRHISNKIDQIYLIAELHAALERLRLAVSLAPNYMDLQRAILPQQAAYGSRECKSRPHAVEQNKARLGQAFMG